VLIDTAGIREAGSDIEREGIRRALQHAAQADLVLWLRDADLPLGEPPEIAGHARLIEAVNKIDLAPSADFGDALRLSVKTGEGLDCLIARLSDEVRQAADIGESPAISRARHRHELERCAAAFDRFLAGDFAALELRAEDLRDAATALGRLTGRVDVEDILDRIFANFCIGK
jgi:tRNA modification GTPase